MGNQPTSIAGIIALILASAVAITVVVLAIVLSNAIAQNKERINDIQGLAAADCRAANQEHMIIRNALIASLTEPDVQANPPQKRAYTKIVNRFARPEPC